ncbi:MAG: SpoVA/SpoVAEb family sporulation membrane protein [Clostridiales bacterium]|uniref:SpoVA/SpoVAEb family sporulation membrane protein n=1 Tax=Candidatus Anaerobutyricum stercoripullorum TaxID=2838456 RepID=A0A9D1X5B3_9FIRM|nr:SpoVA/SpoVAEb family sporulation membrane protein [Clostridiales bacterium]HIX72900.1 SpoVA/SpoVAEb family sporulation membrane protein [Candidatus Anaerobutyricum stercoripullorum]
MKKEPTIQEYAEQVKKFTPKFSSGRNCWHAFVSGGAICLLGEIIHQFAVRQMHMSQENALITVSVSLVLLSVIFTGMQWYAPLAKWCGAGTLVPITGFANSVASPAIEYSAEGQVFGIGVKIFTIAGPVILYGIFSSWIVGLIYWLLRWAGWL